ncbi:MAG: hypothetical protein GQ570_06885 [Helicobacteraceae bacterium]|nr:hypothetical protein [Helicobacteraceae bacterium]
MKKHIFLVLLSFIFLGCGPKMIKLTPIEQSNMYKCRIDNALAPEWLCGKEIYTNRVTVIGSSSIDQNSRESTIKKAFESAEVKLLKKLNYSPTTSHEFIQLKLWQNPNSNKIYLLISEKK